MRAKLRAAEAHLGRGRRLFSQGKYNDAVVELQLAYELSPASDVAMAMDYLQWSAQTKTVAAWLALAANPAVALWLLRPALVGVAKAVA